MGFREVSSLDADVTIAIGKTNKETGKPYPKQAEGYFLGNRTVESPRGDSKLHFLQTSSGNLGVWGTTDLNRKLGSVQPGTMVRITSTGKKPTPNGDMYTYKVEVDADNTIDVSSLESSGSYSDETGETEYNGGGDEDDLAALTVAAEQKAKVEALLNKRNQKKN
jgi:hypothetical protein